MRKHIFILAVILLVAVISFVGLSNGKPKTIKAEGILSVNDIQADPFAYKGNITVTGVVAKVLKQDQKLFAIVDTSEAKTCKSTGCARFYLPVRYEGAMPREWDEVNITGGIVKERGPVFQAIKVEVLKHLTF